MMIVMTRMTTTIFHFLYFSSVTVRACFLTLGESQGILTSTTNKISKCTLEVIRHTVSHISTVSLFPCSE